MRITEVMQQRQNYMDQHVMVRIYPTDENGEAGWAVQVDGTDFWLDFFNTKQEAEEFAAEYNLPVYRGN